MSTDGITDAQASDLVNRTGSLFTAKDPTIGATSTEAVAVASHREEAEDILGMYASPQNDPHGAALAHAVLFLGEQQHIANRLAAATLYGSNPAAWPTEIREALA